MAKRSYRYNGYSIELAVQEVGEKHFEGRATIFGSRDRREGDKVQFIAALGWAALPRMLIGRQRRAPRPGPMHSPTSATGWEPTTGHATQRAAWEALRKLIQEVQ